MKQTRIKWMQLCLLLITVMLLPAMVATADESVTLKATVVEPSYTLYTGHGYLNIEEQVAFGSAVLKIPESIHDNVRLEISRGSQVKIWSWRITEHSHSETSQKNYDYTYDVYKCVDINGRPLTITVQGYYRQNSQRITAFAHGTGALFSGQLR